MHDSETSGFLYARQPLYKRFSGTDITRAFRILDLPRELRDQIYYLICGDHDIDIFYRNARGPTQLYSEIDFLSTIANIEHKTRFPSLKDILSVSRQFSAEAKETIYKTNRFCFRSPRAFRTFIDRLSPSSLSILAHLQIDLKTTCCVEDTWIHQLISSCVVARLPGLLYLRLKIWVIRTYPLGSGSLLFDSSEEILRSSKMRQLKSALLECVVYDVGGNQQRPRHDFERLRQLIAGRGG